MKRFLCFFLALILMLSLFPACAFATTDMKASETIKSYIKSKEGCVLTAYKNPGETNYTIGYGHCATDIYEGMTITKAQADAYFDQDSRKFEKGVNDFMRKYDQQLTQSEFDAMFSLGYNFGETWYDYYTGWRLTKYMTTGFKNYPQQEIADAMSVLCNAGSIIYMGLIERRLQEANTLLFGDSPFDPYDSHFVYIVMDTGYNISTGNRVGAFTKGASYGNLPTASRSGYYFAGWKADDGTVITNSSVATTSYRHLVPVWTTTPPAKTYTLTVNKGAGGGSYPAGTSVRIVPETMTDRQFAGWYGDLSPVRNSDGSYTVTMPARNVTVTASFSMSNCVYGDDCPSKSFVDVPVTHWGHADVDFTVENGIFRGTGPSTFSPNVEMTRAMVVTVLYRLAGEPSVDGIETSFTDVEKDFYYNAVIWAQIMRIANGFEDETFRPGDPVTREQLVTFLQRYASNICGVDTESAQYANLADYSDASQIGEYARQSMSWAVGTGLIKGTTNVTLSPMKVATRVEVATILYRFMTAYDLST